MRYLLLIVLSFSLQAQERTVGLEDPFYHIFEDDINPVRENQRNSIKSNKRKWKDQANEKTEPHKFKQDGCFVPQIICRFR